jgi:hypothetical protein
MPDESKPFEPSTGNLDGVGAPPATPVTGVVPLSPETVAAFNARAEEAAIRADIRVRLIEILGTIGEAAARKFLGL